MIKKFITDLEVVPSITNPVDVYCDNNGAIAQAKEDHISDPNTFLGVIILFEKSLREVTLRYAEFQQMIMLLIN